MNCVSHVLYSIFAGYASAGSSSTSASDGSGQIFTQTSNNGQGQFTYTQNKPGGIPVTTQGNIPPNAGPPFFGPANFGQPAFGLNYGPSFGYNPYGSMSAAFAPYPQPPAFGFNSPFQPLQPLPPYQPIQPYQPFASPLATPQEFSAYLNNIQQQYNTYVCSINFIVASLISYKNLKIRFFLFTFTRNSKLKFPKRNKNLQ